MNEVQYQSRSRFRQLRMDTVIFKKIEILFTYNDFLRTVVLIMCKILIGTNLIYY